MAFLSCSVGKTRFTPSMVQLPVKTQKSFILNAQSDTLFQSFLPLVENLSDSPSWYTPAQQMPHREHLSCLPEKKMIENFVCVASFHCYTFLILLKKTKKNKKQRTGNIKKFQIQRYFISKQEVFSFFCSSNVPHTITQPLNWVLILCSCHKTTSKMQRKTGYLSHFLSYVAIIQAQGFSTTILFPGWEK